MNNVERRLSARRRETKDRRKLTDPKYKGPERRIIKDRRSGKDRRNSN